MLPSLFPSAALCSLDLLDLLDLYDLGVLYPKRIKEVTGGSHGDMVSDCTVTLTSNAFDELN